MYNIRSALSLSIVLNRNKLETGVKMGLQLRLAHYDDKEVLLALFAGLLSIGDDKTKINSAIRDMRYTNQNQYSGDFWPICFLVLEDQDVANPTIHGAIAFGADSKVYAIRIQEDYQGKGYGKLLMSAAAQYVQATKCDALVLTAIKTSIEFYKKLGFEFQQEDIDDLKNGKAVVEFIRPGNSIPGSLSGDKFKSLCHLDSLAENQGVTIDPLYTKLVEKLKSKSFLSYCEAHKDIYDEINDAEASTPKTAPTASSSEITSQQSSSPTFFSSESKENLSLLRDKEVKRDRCCSCAFM